MMSKEGLESVIKAAERSLSSVPKSSSKWVDLQKDLAEAARTMSSLLL